jgi:tRNA (guanine-N7-)-methyltransferase
MRMRKKKHGAERIAACADLLIEDTTPLATLGTNPTAIFPEEKPIHLEIGCGKGAFAVGMAAANPQFNLIAMEKISDVACCALEKAKAAADTRECDNLRFLIGDAMHLSEWFQPHSIARIYLNFSDPWPKKGYAKRRLTYRGFLELYKNILVEGGELYLKTDNEGLFDFSLEEFEAMGLTILFSSRDFHKTPEAEGNVMTEYETNFSAQGMPIYCARVKF